MVTLGVLLFLHLTPGPGPGRPGFPTGGPKGRKEVHHLQDFKES